MLTACVQSYTLFGQADKVVNGCITLLAKLHVYIYTYIYIYIYI